MVGLDSYVFTYPWMTYTHKTNIHMISDGIKLAGVAAERPCNQDAGPVKDRSFESCKRKRLIVLYPNGWFGISSFKQVKIFVQTCSLITPKYDMIRWPKNPLNPRELSGISSPSPSPHRSWVSRHHQGPWAKHYSDRKNCICLDGWWWMCMSPTPQRYSDRTYLAH